MQHTSSRGTLLGALLLLAVLGAAPVAAQTQTLNFPSLADTYVDSSTGGVNYNTSLTLRLDSSPIRITYLRFAVAGVSGRTVQQARLRLGAAGSSAGSGGTVHLISSSAWNEATVTYSTRPAMDGPGLFTLGPVLTVGTVVEFVLDGAITGDGIYNLAIDSASTDGMDYNSSLATSGQTPLLVLTVASSQNPAVTIVQPANGAGFFTGDTVTLQGSASDPVDGNLSAALGWSSSLQGFLGTGASLTTTLAEGSHTITAAVTDSGGRSGSASAAVTVSPPPAANTAPLVTVTAPIDGQTFNAGDSIAFTATATDLEEGVLTPHLAWTSDLDGALGTGGSFARTLSSGTHHITARVTDTGGLVGSATVTVAVRAPVAMEFLTIADATVDAGSPTTNMGADPLLKADANTLRIAYMRFAVSGVTGSVRRAVLRMQVDTGANAGSNVGGVLHTISSTTWAENTVTFNTRPALDGPIVASVGPVSSGQLVDYDVTAVVQGNGTYNFALENSSSDATEYRSREGLPAPKLILTLAGNAPAVSISSPLDQAAVNVGDPVVCTGSATDTEDGNLSAGLAWTSSLDGPIGSGASFTTSALRAGTHTIIAGVSDSSGLRGQATATLTVRAPNVAPTVAVTGPVSGTSVGAGTAVTLAATATDPQDGNLGAAIRWSSNLQGVLGSGASLTLSTLQVGTHALTASVTDSGGLTGQAQTSLIVTPANHPPVVTIAAPADGSSVASGASVVLSGSATDLESGNLSSTLSWLSSLQGVLGVGSSVTVSLIDGAHVLTASVSDAGGLTGQAQVHVQVGAVSTGPTVTISSPLNGARVVAGTAIAFSGTATDPVDGNLGARLAWSSDIDGPIGGGASFTTGVLRVGTHQITAAVTDAAGLTGQAQITLVITAPNLPPVVRITAPPAGTSPIAGVPVLFTATATDAIDGNLGAGIVWSSNLQGPLGTGPSITTPLNQGTHTITASATDSGGATGSTSLTVVALSASTNSAPSVLLVSPRDTRTYVAGEAATFVAVAEDREDGLLTGSLRWQDDRDGALGTGGSLTRALSQGVHHVTVSVTDGGGLTGSATATVTVVVGGTLTFPASADTYVDASHAGTAYGTASTLYAQGSPVKQAFFRFAVTNVSAGSITQARLRLTVNSGSSDGSLIGGTVYAMTNNSWSETKTTYKLKPAIDGLALASRGAVAKSQVVDFDVTPAIAGSGTYSFALVSSSTDSVRYRTRESSTGKPQLILTIGSPRITLSGSANTNGFVNGSLPSDVTIDGRTATYLGSSTNSYPLNLGGGAGVWLVGPMVLGQYDRTLAWADMHGMNNAGVNFDNPQFVVDGMRLDNLTDGIRPQNGGSFTIRNVHMSYMRDDCVENDHVHGGLVDDSLFDGCYAAFSARPSPAIIAGGANGSTSLWRIENSLVRLQPMPGPDGGSADNLGNAGFFKWDGWDSPSTSLSPKLALHNNVFMAERVGQAGASRMGIPPGQLVTCSNNVMVWLGPGDYPTALPTCFTVTKDRTVWDNAVTSWLARHPQVRP